MIFTSYAEPEDYKEAGLTPPWYTFGKMVKALFEGDDEIDVMDVEETEEGEDEDYVLTICVMNHDKAVALDRAMPDTKEYGNVILRIDVIDGTNTDTNQDLEIFKTIFAGNPIVRDFKTRTDSAGGEWSYCRFEPEVIQFWNDDLSDYSGNWSGLAHDIADEIFKDKFAVGFCIAALNEDAEGDSEEAKTEDDLEVEATEEPEEVIEEEPEEAGGEE